MGILTLNGESVEKLMDDVGWHILQELQVDARISYSELGRRVGLSSPAAAERVRRMEDAGIIKGYRVEIDPAKIGLPIMAIIRVRADDCRRIMDYVNERYQELPEVLECHRITGEDSIIMRVVVADIPHLENLVDRVRGFGETTTSIVLSSLAEDRMYSKDMMRQ
jgi:Lrp/AsnC family transcriptional regulator, leucine-responsive regulatory protein